VGTPARLNRLEARPSGVLAAGADDYSGPIGVASTGIGDFDRPPKNHCFAFGIRKPLEVVYLGDHVYRRRLRPHGDHVHAQSALPAMNDFAAVQLDRSVVARREDARVVEAHRRALPGSQDLESGWGHLRAPHPDHLPGAFTASGGLRERNHYLHRHKPLTLERGSRWYSLR
jgi:hypothetical protein